jgi:hypothetical protein
MNKKSLTEADIRTKSITPALAGADGNKWNIMTQLREEIYFTKGRVIVRGKTVKRGEAKKADYILFYKPNIPIAVIEAKDNIQPRGLARRHTHCLRDAGVTGVTSEEVIMKNTMYFLVFALVSIAMVFSGCAGHNQVKASRMTGPDPAAVKAINELGFDLEKLNQSHQNLMNAIGELNGLYTKLALKVEEASRIAADAKKTKGDPTSQLFKATEQMHEMQMSFNLQYLMLQNKISHENRQFSMVSNIMKNKHETAKNSINNIR